MSFAKSDALFPTGPLQEAIAEVFAKQCRLLCFGPFPAWDALQTRLEAIRDVL